MLQRQQAQAVVAARTKIVEGAVGMVQMASIISTRTTSSSSMTSGGPPWSPTCWWSCAATATPSPWSTPAPSIHDRTRGVSAAHRPQGARRRPALGQGRSAQRQRPDRVSAAAGAQAGGETAEERHRHTVGVRRAGPCRGSFGIRSNLHPAGFGGHKRSFGGADRRVNPRFFGSIRRPSMGSPRRDDALNKETPRAGRGASLSI